MANITELQFQGDSTVHKLNDARITTTEVSNATHFLATDSSISSIAPIASANLASVLGELGNFRPWLNWTDGVNANELDRGVIYCGEHCANVPVKWCQIITLADGAEGCQIAVSFYNGILYWRNGKAAAWKKAAFNIPDYYKDYSTLAELKAALDAL